MGQIDCPEPEDRLVLIEVRQSPQIKWMAVPMLLRLAGQVLVAKVVGSMTGRRELLAALDASGAGLSGIPASSPGPDDLEIVYRPEDGSGATFEMDADAPKIEHDYSDCVGEKEAFWFDYLADTGDGWDATYSVAWLLGRDTLSPTVTEQMTGSLPPDLENPQTNPETRSLPAGRILFIGGDLVYPTGSRRAYRERLRSPYSCARPKYSDCRHLFAIPGNHDWYDGLTAFIRLLCQKTPRHLGAWWTRQRRSYFAVKLPHGWWLWGVDLALEDDLDAPQIAYFEDQSRYLKSGDNVILCVPTPSWLKDKSELPIYQKDVQAELDRLQIITQIIRKSPASRALDNNAGGTADGQGVRVPLYLAGDLHHYARYNTSDRDGDPVVVSYLRWRRSLHVADEVLAKRDHCGQRSTRLPRRGKYFPKPDRPLLAFTFRNTRISIHGLPIHGRARGIGDPPFRARPLDNRICSRRGA